MSDEWLQNASFTATINVFPPILDTGLSGEVSAQNAIFHKSWAGKVKSALKVHQTTAKNNLLPLPLPPPGGSLRKSGNLSANGMAENRENADDIELSLR